MSELYLIRHGQASFGDVNYDQLSELGYRQSNLLGQYFYERKIAFDYLVVGSMLRHHQTMQGICNGLEVADVPSYICHEGFNEYDFKAMVGEYARLHPDEDLVRQVAADPMDKKAFYRLLRRVLTSWSTDLLNNGVFESWAAFQQRVQNARTLVHELAQSSARVMVVSSGGALSQFIGSVLSLLPEKVLDINMQMLNTGISHFYFNESKINLASFNGIPHLDSPEYLDFITYG